jgi:hypothetical protein
MYVSPSDTALKPFRQEVAHEVALYLYLSSGIIRRILCIKIHRLLVGTIVRLRFNSDLRIRFTSRNHFLPLAG